MFMNGTHGPTPPGRTRAKLRRGALSRWSELGAAEPHAIRCKATGADPAQHETSCRMSEQGMGMVAGLLLREVETAVATRLWAAC